MDKETQLLCTFTTSNELTPTMGLIEKSYKLIFNKIYVLENVQDSSQLVLTYNIEKGTSMTSPSGLSTISVHRKKHTNTIYTINAINKLIEGQNNGVLDKNFKIDWEQLKNCVLVTAYNNLKIVQTKLIDIIEIE